MKNRDNHTIILYNIAEGCGILHESSVTQGMRIRDHGENGTYCSALVFTFISAVSVTVKCMPAYKLFEEVG